MVHGDRDAINHKAGTQAVQSESQKSESENSESNAGFVFCIFVTNLQLVIVRLESI